MAKFRVTGPDGGTYEVEAPEGATDADVFKMVSGYAKGPQAAPKPQVGMLESFGRGITSGALMGFEDEIGLADKQKQSDAKTANPISNFVGNVVGGVGSMLVPGAAAARVGQVGKAVLSPFVAKGAATVGGAAKEGAKLGASYGAISGAGHSDDKLKGAAEGAVAGTFMGGVLGPVAHKIGERYQIGQAAKKEMENSDIASLAALDRGLARDRIAPQTLIDQIQVPQYGKLTSDQISQIAERVGRGETVEAAGQALGVGADAARRGLARFEANNASPLSMVDRARLTGVAGGENTAWTMRAAMASPGQGRAHAAEALTQRQLEQAPRLANAADDIIAAGDPAKRMEAMKAAEKAAYDDAFAQAKPFDIEAHLNAVDGQFAGRSTDIAKTMQKASELFAEKAPGRPPEFKPFQRLDHFQEAKRDLDQLIASSMPMGKPTPMTRELMKLKDQLMTEVNTANPAFKQANQVFSENAAARRMFDDVQNTGFRLTPESKGQMTRLAKLHEAVASRKATPQEKQIAQAEIDMARDAFSNAVKAVTMNARETGDHTARLLTPAAQQYARAILGRKDGDAFIKALREEQAITQSYRALGGSQTTPLREAIDELNGPPLIASAFKNWSPTELASAVVAKGSAKLSEARNNRMLPMMVDADPKKQLALFRDIQKMRNARVTGGRKAVSGVPAFASAVSEAVRLNESAPAMARKPR